MTNRVELCRVLLQSKRQPIADNADSWARSNQVVPMLSFLLANKAVSLLVATGFIATVCGAVISRRGK